MIRNLHKAAYILTIIFYLLFIFIIYFSSDNRSKIIKNRSNFNYNMQKKNFNLPILENDTNNIIEYNFEGSKNNKIKKRYFWNLLDDKK